MRKNLSTGYTAGEQNCLVTDEHLPHEVYLQTIGKDNRQASEEQLETLQSIAAQCPDEGGIAVVWAINLHGILTGSWLEVQPCGVGERAKKGMDEQFSNSFRLYPNPAHEKCFVEYATTGYENGKILVSDHLGRVIHSYPLISPSGKINIDNLPQGFYLISLSIKGSNQQIEKLTKF